MKKLPVVVFLSLLLPATGFGNVGNHSLFIKADGSLWGMGLNGNGQLGDGSTSERHSHVKVVDANVTTVAGGQFKNTSSGAYKIKVSRIPWSSVLT